MSEHSSPRPVPADIGETHPDRRDRVRADVAALAELAAAGVEVDGRVQLAESTWVIYGHTSYDGEVMVGRYRDGIEASEVLRAAPRRRPGPAGPPNTLV